MRTPTLPRRLAAIAAAAMIFALAGCSNSASTDSGGSAPMGVPTAAGGAAESKAGDAAAPAAAPAAVPTGVPASERKVARTAQLTLGISDPAKSAKDVRAAAESLGGYVLSENVVTEQKDGFYIQPSSVTVSVPSAKLDDALDALAKLGDVRNRVVNSADVTTQVVDTDARIASLRESIARIEALMAKAGSVTEIAAVERELTQRQSELESMVAQQQALADRVAMAPITVTLRPAQTVSDPNPLWQGLTAGWSALLTSLRILITTLGALAPFAVLALVVWLPIRWWRRKHPRPVRVPATMGMPVSWPAQAPSGPAPAGPAPQPADAAPADPAPAASDDS